MSWRRRSVRAALTLVLVVVVGDASVGLSQDGCTADPGVHLLYVLARMDAGDHSEAHLLPSTFELAAPPDWSHYFNPFNPTQSFAHPGDWQPTPIGDPLQSSSGVRVQSPDGRILMEVFVGPVFGLSTALQAAQAALADTGASLPDAQVLCALEYIDYLGLPAAFLVIADEPWTYATTVTIIDPGWPSAVHYTVEVAPSAEFGTVARWVFLPWLISFPPPPGPDPRWGPTPSPATGPGG